MSWVTADTKVTSPTEKNFRWAEFDELLAESDVVSLHCPLTPETEGIINAETLKKMKKSAFLINTSRGPLIAEEDLAYALNNDHIAGAGLDVLAVEPPGEDNPLFRAKKLHNHAAYCLGFKRGKGKADADCSG